MADQGQLFTAIKTDFPPMLIDALEAGVDPDCADSSGFTPLLAAISLNRVEMVAELAKRGADVNRPLNGFTPLMVVAQEGRCDAAKILIESGADINASNEAGLTVLMCAVRDGHDDIVAMLLSKGVDTEAKTQQGSTASDLAADVPYPSIRSLLQIHTGG